MSEVAAAQAPKVDIGAWVIRVVFLAVGLIVLYFGHNYKIRDENGLVGPGMMPFFAGLVMVVATLLEGIVEFRRQRQPVSPQDAGNAIADADALAANARTPTETRRAVLIVFGVILATVLLTQLIGLLLALTVMVFVLVWPVEHKPWWSAAIAALLAFILGFVVFGLVLGVPLPTGLLGLV